jgi:thiol-disulfide isomerase/thioredoxin
MSAEQTSKILFYYIDFVELEIPGYKNFVNGSLNQVEKPQEYIRNVLQSHPVQECHYQFQKNDSLSNKIRLSKNLTDEQLKNISKQLWLDVKFKTTKPKFYASYIPMAITSASLSTFSTFYWGNSKIHPLIDGALVGIVSVAGHYLTTEINNYFNPTNVSNFDMFRFEYFENSFGRNISKKEVLTKKIIALYFGALYCGPCQKFIPDLIRYFKNANKRDPDLLSIIYMSWDKSEEDYKQSMHKKPWVAAPYENSGKLNPESYFFRVKQIPSLIFIETLTGNILKDYGPYNFPQL